MNPTTVSLSNGTGLYDVGSQRVYVRASWFASWTLVPDLFCSELVWCASPAIPSASFVWHYGSIRAANSATFSEVLKLSGIARWFVKVEYDYKNTSNGWLTKSWYGTFDVLQDRMDGERILDGQRVASGSQQIHGYGLANLLSGSKMFASAIEFDGGVKFIERSLTFNRNGLPNRSENPTGGVHVFSSLNPEHWSTSDILNYLLFVFSPRNETGVVQVPFTLQPNNSSVPTWDRPEVATDLKTPINVIESILSRHRLKGFYFDVASTSNGNIVYCVPFSYSDSTFLLPNGSLVPQNAFPLHVVFSNDLTGSASLKTSVVDTYDRVVCFGARRRSVFSISFDDATLEEGWTSTIESEYETGASTDPNYPAAGEVAKRQRADSEFRTNPQFVNVYRRFAMTDDWDGLTNGGQNEDPDRSAFPEQSNTGAIDETKTNPFFRNEIVFDSTLPLKLGVDYSGSKIGDGNVFDSDAPDIESPPLVIISQPDQAGVAAADEKFFNVSQIGIGGVFEDLSGANSRWSADVEMSPTDASFFLHVDGQHQWVIAEADFTKLPDDPDFPQLDYNTLIATVSVAEDRRIVAAYPPLNMSVGNVPVYRTLQIDCGDRYQRNYVAPNTVVGLNADGTISRSDGGFVRDDTQELESIAKTLFRWYGRERSVLTLETFHFETLLDIGRMITGINIPDADNVGGHYRQSINSVITEIRISFSEGTAESPPPVPLWRITTQAGELDPMQLDLSSGSSQPDAQGSNNQGVTGQLA